MERLVRLLFLVLDGVLRVKVVDLLSRQIRKPPDRQVYRRAQRRTLRMVGIQAHRDNLIKSSSLSSCRGVDLRPENQRWRTHNRILLTRLRHLVEEEILRLLTLHAGASTEQGLVLDLKVDAGMSS